MVDGEVFKRSLHRGDMAVIPAGALGLCFHCVCMRACVCVRVCVVAGAVCCQGSVWQGNAVEMLTNRQRAFEPPPCRRPLLAATAAPSRLWHPRGSPWACSTRA